MNSLRPDESGGLGKFTWVLNGGLFLGQTLVERLRCRR